MCFSYSELSELKLKFFSIWRQVPAAEMQGPLKAVNLENTNGFYEVCALSFQH